MYVCKGKGALTFFMSVVQSKKIYFSAVQFIWMLKNHRFQGSPDLTTIAGVNHSFMFLGLGAGNKNCWSNHAIMEKAYHQGEVKTQSRDSL